MTSRSGHIPVLVEAVVAALAPRAGGAYVDATFGSGGYARAILAAAPCRVWGIDRDPEAAARAGALVARFEGRLVVLRGWFGELDVLLERAGAGPVDGVAFDLGMSSEQVDSAGRGFSFRLEGPLDMRMDPERGPSAAEVVGAASEADLAELIWRYGEERAARRIAAAIVRARQAAPIETTARLADVVRRATGPAPGAVDPATRTFQALRIHVNDELGELDRGLSAAERVLGPGGRLAVVSYHSLEDRRVKGFLRRRSEAAPRPSRHRPDVAPEGVGEPSFRLLRRGALRPSAAEVAGNPRARSARLRAAERTAAPPWPPEFEPAAPLRAGRSGR